MNYKLLQQKWEQFVATLSPGAQQNILEAAKRGESITYDGFKFCFEAIFFEDNGTSGHTCPDCQANYSCPYCTAR